MCGISYKNPVTHASRCIKGFSRAVHFFRNPIHSITHADLAVVSFPLLCCAPNLNASPVNSLAGHSSIYANIYCLTVQQYRHGLAAVRWNGAIMALRADSIFHVAGSQIRRALHGKSIRMDRMNVALSKTFPLLFFSSPFSPYWMLLRQPRVLFVCIISALMYCNVGTVGIYMSSSDPVR